MKLTKQFISSANFILKSDEDFRLEEFNKYKTFHPKLSNYPIEKMKKIWPSGTYFSVNTVEGLYGEMDGKFLIIFRGSDGIIDWIQNFLFWKKVIPYKELGTNKKIRVHYGFYKGYMEVRDYIHSIVRGTDLKEIVFHGHSRGAGLAALAALDIQFNFKEKEVGGFVIGMPRLGNSFFKDSFEKRIPTFTRIDYGSDSISILPPSFFGFVDTGNLIHIGPKRVKGFGYRADHHWTIYYDTIVKELEEKEYS